jgi:YbbR domain-containing protein
MDSLASRIFLQNWQRKLVALLAALVVWILVSHSITDTKTIRSVPIRIVNLPADKTIIGLLPNGILNKKINLTLTGTKDVIDELEPGDLEVLIDASTIDHADWIVQITKKNLWSLNPAVDLSNHITAVEHTEFVLKLNRLITLKVPVTIAPPTGEAPPGYEYLDIWPQTMMQTLSGPEEELQKLQTKGLTLTFDLNNITKAELDAIKSSHHDETAFIVPIKWKQVEIPFRNHVKEELNDPEAQNLRIDFLRQEFLALDRDLPIQIYYPIKSSEALNPATLTLAYDQNVKAKHDIPFFAHPVSVKGTSRLFLDIVRDYLEIVIVSAPKAERDVLQWSFNVIDPRDLEDTYVAFMMTNSSLSKNTHTGVIKKREFLLRQRFRNYLQKMSLWITPDHKLNIESTIEDNKIHIVSF